MAKLATLTDAFGSLDTTKWTFSANATINAGRLQLATSATYQGARSVAAYDLTDSSLTVEMVQTAGPGNGTVGTQVTIDDGVNRLYFLREGSQLYALRRVASTVTTVAQVAYNATSHRWWRIAHSGGQVSWQVSADGVAWTTLGTPWTPTFAITALAVDMQTGFYGTEPSPGVALIDSVNPSTATNVAPTVNAGPDQANVEPWAPVTLTGTDSDSDGTIASRTWTQTAGSPTVTLAGTGGTRTFEAPATVPGTTLTFQYAATDDDGATTTDTMTVSVLPAAERILMGGSWVPSRTRIVTAPPPGITRVGEAATKVSGTGTGTDITTALPAGIQAGDFLLLEVGTGLGPYDLTDPAGWTPLRRVVDPGTSPAEAGLELWWKIAGASETAPTLTSATATRWHACIKARRGVHATNPFIAQDGAAESGATTTLVHAAPTLTNTVAGAWGEFSMVSRQVVTPYTAEPGPGLVERVDQETGNAATANTLYFTADSNGPVPVGSVTYSATGSGGSAVAAMWAGLLRPAS